MQGVIERIRIYPQKGSAGLELQEAQLIEGLGLDGDYHAPAGKQPKPETRQLSLLPANSRDELTKQKEKGLCFSRFKENICIHGITADAIRPGARLETEEVVLEITGETKRCHEECGLYQAGKLCPLAGQSLFAKVLKGGLIRAGDKITEIHNDQKQFPVLS